MTPWNSTHSAIHVSTTVGRNATVSKLQLPAPVPPQPRPQFTHHPLAQSRDRSCSRLTQRLAAF